MSVRVRFAPSPTGRLHLGNIRAALVNWLFAKKSGGSFILRIDDTDRERSTSEYEALIKKDLQWLGLDWDETFRQSERFERYHDIVEKLKDDGRLYPCYETAEELEMKRRIQRGRGLPPVYDRAALSLTKDQIVVYEAEGRKPHWRFKLALPARIDWHDLIRGPVSIDLESVSDPILIRADGSYLYTLPSVVDDADFGITHIVRGEDHVTNSAVQVQIFEAIGHKAPEMAHFALLTGKGGEGLSKRHGAMSISDYREEAGMEPEAILSLMARVGTSDPVEAVSHIDALVDTFDFSKFSRAAARLDSDEIAKLNSRIVRGMTFEQVKERLSDAGMTEVFWDAVRANLDKVEDAKDWLAIMKGPVNPVIEDKDYIDTALQLLPEGRFNDKSWQEWTARISESTGAKGRALFMPLRLALTGQSHGPDMGILLPLIGREKVAARLEGREV